MKHFMAILVACSVLAFQLHTTEAQGFSFSLPGKWGGAGKRSGGVPWLKEGLGECGMYDTSLVVELYKMIQAEAVRLNECLLKAQRETN